MIEVKQLSRSDFEDYGIPFNHIYVLNDGNTGKIIINSALEIDIEKIDKVEDLKIKKLEWTISGSGSTFVILSHEKLSTDYITKLMLSRLYTELQKKSNKKKIVYVDASSTTTVPAGGDETIIIQPPKGKIWRLRSFYFEVSAIAGATEGTHSLRVHTYSTPAGHAPYIANTYNAPICVCDSVPAPWGYNSLSPNDQFGWQKYLQSLIASYNYPLTVFYKNGTDADQTKTRTIRLLVEEEDEAT